MVPAGFSKGRAGFGAAPGVRKSCSALRTSSACLLAACGELHCARVGRPLGLVCGPSSGGGHTREPNVDLPVPLGPNRKQLVSDSFSVPAIILPFSA